MWTSKLHPGAEEDLQESIAWYAEQDPRAADRFLGAVKQALLSIASDPERCATISSGIHAYSMTKYPFQIVFRIHDFEMEVLAISHASRRSGYWTNRLDG
jgi:plasmid stabilization system protein ParE